MIYTASRDKGLHVRRRERAGLQRVHEARRRRCECVGGDDQQQEAESCAGHPCKSSALEMRLMRRCVAGFVAFFAFDMLFECIRASKAAQRVRTARAGGRAYEPIFIIKSALKSVARSPPGHFEKSLEQLMDESKKKIAKKG